MFDFIFYITKNKLPERIRFNQDTTEKYLKEIPYQEDIQFGIHYVFSSLKHKESVFKTEAIYSGRKVIVLGNVFTTRDYAYKQNSKPKRVTPDDILQMYIEHGDSFIKNLKGVFLILVLDDEKSQYLVFSCRSGLYDAYYYIGSEFVLISTSIESILKFPGIPTDIDPVSLIQFSVFDYPLGERTLFKNIKPFPPSSVLTYNLLEYNLSQYFDYSQLLNQSFTLSWKETFSQAPDLFNESIDLLCEGHEKICAAITSGFDSRTNLSRLINSNKDILYYSWGMKGSVEITIPELISSKTGINYTSILLNEDFEKKYDYFAKQSIYWSSGKATIRRANHNYSYSILSKHSSQVVTGLYGSELIRPVNALGHIYNKEFIDVLYSENQIQTIKDVYKAEKNKLFIKDEFLTQFEDSFLSETVVFFNSLKFLGPVYKQLYFFALNEGFRKYFGHELNASRIYVKVDSPYIDDDFVEFILKTPIPALNLHAFKRNIKTLKLGQSFYLPIIESNFKKLMKIKTGRYYTPQNLNSKLFPLSVLPGMIRKKIHQLKSNDTFNDKKWNNQLYNSNRELCQFENEYFNTFDNVKDNIPANYENNQQTNWNMYLAKHFSLRFWLCLCGFNK